MNVSSRLPPKTSVLKTAKKQCRFMPLSVFEDIKALMDAMEKYMLYWQ